MVASIFDRPMFRGQQPMMPEDTGERLQPKASIVEAQEGAISYPVSRITQPLGSTPAGIMEAAAQFANQVNPAEFAAQAETLQPARSRQEIAAEYDALYADEPAEAPDYSFEKNLALARAGLALMQPTVGGTIAPSIAKAGDQFVQDVAAIRGKEREAQTEARKLQQAQDQARRQYILDTRQAEVNATKALQGKLIMEAFGFNLGEDQRSREYMRDLNKMFYNYQYDTDADAMKRHFELLKERYDKKGEVLYDQQTGKFAMGYIQENDAGMPIPYFPVNEGGVFKYVPRPEAIITNFTLNNKGDFDPGAKQVMDLASGINNAKLSLKFIRDVQQSIVDNPGIIGLPGFATDFTQSVGSTAFDIMDALKARGAIDEKAYNKNVSRIENSVVSNLKDSYVKYNKQGDKNANNFDKAEGTPEYEIYRTFFNPEIAKNKVRLNSIYYALARARKDTGRLNVDDINNAKDAIDLFGLGGSDAIKASLSIVYEQIENRLKSDLLQLGEGYDNLISDIPYTSFIGQTAGQDIFISSTEAQTEFTPSKGSSTFVEPGVEGSAPKFNENLGAGN
jgi:uncharacterized membrane protein|tara:strand:- start:4420 stop:6114 length:1695 start_codon:yes stop_codon:yes gene_type:complete